jgi:protein-disulfide isomerase
VKEYLNSLRFSLSLIIASLIIGISIVLAARILGEAVITKEIIAARILAGKTNLAKAGDSLSQERMKPGSRIVKGVTPGSNPLKGSPNAPVLMVEFSDFQCPFSKQFYQEKFPKLDKEYIASGQLKFAYRDFPLAFHPLAQLAAAGSRCANKQNKYWQMFDKLSLSSSLEPEIIQRYAKEINLDIKAFNSCLNSQKIKEEVVEDLKEGARFGVKGTPAFFINGRLIPGNLDYEVFKEIIEEEIKKSKK